MMKFIKILFQWLFPSKRRAPVLVKPVPVLIKPKPEPILSIEDWSGNDYISSKPKSGRRTIIRTKGKVYNLTKIYNRLNKGHFKGSIKAKITWGRYGCRNVRRRWRITFGTYSSYELLIRIHPALDSKEIPELFVEHVIHHEMLHEAYPPIRGNGNKRIVHHYAFRVAEAATPTYGEAMKWERQNIKMFFQEPKTRVRLQKR